MVGRQGDMPFFIYLFISALFIDTVFKATTINEFYLKDTILSILSLLFYVLIVYLIISFFYGKTQYILSILLLGFFAFIYSSQFIYFKFFRTFYSFYSVSEGMQVIDFWSDILYSIGENSRWIALFFAPIFILLIFGRRYFMFLPLDRFKKGIVAGLIVIVYLLSLGILHLGDKGQHSAHDLYYKSNFPQLSVQRMGLLTTMRLDIQRYLTNWSPVLDSDFIQTEPPENPSPSVDPDNNPSGENNEEENEHPKNENDEKEEVVEYNVLDIDFEELIANEKNEEIKGMHEYFNSIEPTKKNEYTGKYEGYNLILLTAESFAPYAVHKEKTPTLYKMIHEGYHFTNFYTPIWEVSTSDGEYVALNSLLPKSGVWSFQETGENENHLPFVLGNQLNQLDYETRAYHNHTYTYYGRDLTHPNLGYHYKGLGNGLEVEETWPESDLEMMEKTVSEYIDKEPFHTYYMTVSGHMRHSFSGNYIAWKNQNEVEDLPYSEQGRAYIAQHIELDRALEYLLDELKEKGIAEETLIALSSDHYPYGLDDEAIDELVGHNVEENFELYKNNFILYTEGMEPKTIDKPASSLDILPTLSNLLGLDYDSRLMMGQDIFSDAPALIPFLNRSFITEYGKFNSVTQEFTPVDEADVDDDYVEQMKAIVQAKFYYSTKVLENDYYEIVYPD